MNLQNIPLEYVVLALVGVVLYLIYYLFTKDTQYSRNIHSIASVVEELNRDIFYLKKQLHQAEEKLQESKREMSDDEIYQEIERSVYDMLQPLSANVKQLHDRVHNLDMEIDARIASVESGVKQISIPSSIHGNDDEKIISLYKQGVSLETISKELHISKPEVEFVLKINRIR